MTIIRLVFGRHQTLVYLKDHGTYNLTYEVPCSSKCGLRFKVWGSLGSQLQSLSLGFKSIYINLFVKMRTGRLIAASS